MVAGPLPDRNSRYGKHDNPPVHQPALPESAQTDHGQEIIQNPIRMKNRYKYKSYNNGRDHAGQKEDNPKIALQLQFCIDSQCQEQSVQVFPNDDRYGIDKGIAYRQSEFAVLKYGYIILDSHKANTLFSYCPVCKRIIDPINTGGYKKDSEYAKCGEHQPVAV